MIKIIFFDADGTLWYPKLTKRKANPIWVHTDRSVKDAREHLIPVPGAHSTLSKLKKQGIKLVVLSASPLPARTALQKIKSRLEHFKILKFFDEVYATKTYFESKGEHMLKILKRYKIKKSEALMIGDVYLWDFVSAKRAGVKCYLFEHSYDPKPHYKKVKTKLKNFNDILKIT